MQLSSISDAEDFQCYKDCKGLNSTFISIGEKNHISISSVVNIFDQFVSMNPKMLPRVLSIDEFYLEKTWSNKFVSIFIDPK